MAREERAACHHLQMTFQNSERSDAGLHPGQDLYHRGRLLKSGGMMKQKNALQIRP